MSHVRCKSCRARRTLAMRPDHYMPGRVPRCLGCGKRAGWNEDRWRSIHEVGPKAKKPCRCNDYPFPHARGRGWCEHNQAITLGQRQERWESGGRQGL